MARRQVIEGTSEEIATALQSGAFAGRRMRVIIEPDEMDYSDQLADPVDSVHDMAQLKSRLLEGLSSPAHEMTDALWQDLHKRATERNSGAAR
jgi:hypothetical protein